MSATPRTPQRTGVIDSCMTFPPISVSHAFSRLPCPRAKARDLTKRTREGFGASLALLIAGVVAGAGVTTGLVLGVVAVIANDNPATALGAPHFVDETAESGIHHVYDGDFSFFVGGGVASFDCDDDLKPDLYVAGGESPAGLYRNLSEAGGPLRFGNVADSATDMVDVTGAYPIDIDSDGITDLALLRYGENAILRGLGDCEFERADHEWNIDGGDEWTAAFSAKWEGDSILPTLAFGNYVALDGDGTQTGRCSDNVMFRAEGAAYDAPIPLAPGWCALSILFSDWDRSGRRDLRVTNDRHYYVDGEEQLWRVSEGEPPGLYTHEQGWGTLKIWGMGIASQDITGDGLPEVYLTSQGDNKLQTLANGPERPSYEDIALRLGANAHRPFIGDNTRPSTAWHAEFEDVNNDGLMDLFVTKGNVEAMPEFAENDPNNLLLGQPDGTFIEGAADAGLLDYARSRGATLTDFNLDGLLDAIVIERREPLKIWRNVGSGNALHTQPMGNWLSIDLEQEGVNRDGIGSWIQVRAGGETTEREVTIGGGHAGGELGWVHFGLGDADRAELRVLWPDGEAGPWIDVDANRFLIVDRETGSAQTWSG